MPARRQDCAATVSERAQRESAGSPRALLHAWRRPPAGSGVAYVAWGAPVVAAGPSGGGGANRSRLWRLRERHTPLTLGCPSPRRNSPVGERDSVEGLILRSYFRWIDRRSPTCHSR
jgi:hypothetical protein